MRVLLLGLLVMALAAAGVHWAVSEPGYVLLARGNLSVEMSLVVFALLVVLLFLALYFIIRFVARTWRLRGDLNKLHQRRRQESARRGLTRGLIELAEGRWAQGERLLVRSGRRSETPLLNYLAAARAAQMQGAYERRDEYLRWAIESDPDAKVAVGLSQAELQLAHRQYEQALATLNHVNELSPRHGYVLRLLARLYLRLEDWKALHALLPSLRNRDVYEPEELKDLERSAVTGLLERYAAEGDQEAVDGVWKTLPRAGRDRAELVLVYAKALQTLKEPEKAATTIKSALSRNWNEDLIYAYGQVGYPDPAKPLTEAEAWLKAHGRSPMLLLTLGRLCRQARLWGKSRIYFESSLGLQPLPETYRELGALLEQMGDHDHAQECYRKGLRLAVEGVAEPVELPKMKSAATGTSPALKQDPDLYSV